MQFSSVSNNQDSENKDSNRSKTIFVQVGLGLTLSLLLAMTWLSYQSFYKLTAIRLKVDRSLNVIVHLQSLYSSVKDAESGQRGYLLTGRDSYLKPYLSAHETADRELNEIRHLITDNADQQSRLDQCSVLITEKFTELQQVIDLRSQKSLPAALVDVNSDTGMRLMERIRTIISTMNEEENKIYDKNNQAVRENSRQLAILVGEMAITVAGLLVVMLGWLQREALQLQNAEKAVRRSEQMFRLLVSNVKDYAIIMLDTEGRIVTWNEGAERIKGYTAEEIIGRHFSVLYPQADIDAGKPARELEEATKNGACEDLGWRVRKDGSQFFANVIITALKDEEGNAIGFGKVVRDISDRKQAEEAILSSKQELEVLNAELAQSRDQAQAASKFKSEFVANMSHEIRTPMNGIIGMCNILLKTTLDENQRGYAMAVKEAGNALLTVINDILDFSKIEAGRVEIEIIEFDAVTLVEGVCEILALQARSKNLSLMSFVDPAMPLRLRGDPERLRQILINLTSNAIKFSEKGEITVRAQVESANEDIVIVRFSVADKGIGISAEDQEKLFQPFTQADGTISRKFGGTGLGLSISKRLVQLMHGTIGVQSTADSGSTFWFVVPLERRSAAPIASAKKELMNVQVIIVDDEPNTREILNNYVVSWGMRNGTAKNAQEGLSMMKAAALSGDPYQLAIVDLVMPDMTGIEMAREIIDDPELSNTKLILLTAFDTPGLGSQAIDIGFRAYISKPVRQSQMLDCLVGVVCGGRQITASHSINGANDGAKSNLPTKHATERSELILVVEDHPINQQVAELYLRDLGFSSAIAKNGKEAVQAVMNGNFALVLMDCQMPEMDGLSATHEIRKVEAHTGKHTTIVAMTAHAMEGDREKCIAAGMDDYIVKPLDPGELEAIIDKWISSSRSSRLVDFASLDSQYGAHARRLLELFAKDVPPQIEKLKESAKSNSTKDVLIYAHGLKSDCGAIFAPGMGQQCNDIEIATRQNDWPGVQQLMGALEIEFDEILQVLKSANRI